MKKKKLLVLFVILLLVVGYAAVSTTLNITGLTKVGENKEDFDVYFSNAKEGTKEGTVENKKVIKDDTHIAFNKDMKSVGETYVLEYDVTNGSRTYDANIAITCTNSTEYLKITNEFDTSTDLLATETRSGKLTVEVIKSYVGTTEKPTLDTAISCEITGNAKERTSRATGTPAAKVVHEKSWKLTNDADSNGELSIGDLITLGTESFYVYNVDGDNVKALAQYNLLVGNSSNGSTATPLENVTGLQDASAGAKVDGASNYKGTVAFDDDSKVYETSTIKSNYVDPYMNTLNELGGNVESIGLITYEELTSDTLGCKFNGNTCISSPYDWLYSTSYWIDAGNSMAVNSNGDISNCYYTIDIWYGVRPVITISKSLL